ncbi:MAG: N-acetylmuramoyl-L-alanine amidase [bacterium]|nr:N-acetylmuramoyl-L-alanine amidase [bacterium]
MNKYKILIVITFIICTMSLIKVKAYIYDLPLLTKIIYLDPGHGGTDPGAIYQNVLEKDINLIISKKLGAKLESLGATVLYTRTDDYDLATPHATLRKRSDLGKRADLINESKCDMYISIHLNAYSSPKWKGLQIFYDSVNKNNEDIAKSLTTYIKQNIKNTRDYKLGLGYYMYQRITVPGVLIEVGFISNPEERYLLQQETYQEKVVTAIALAINNYYN